MKERGIEFIGPCVDEAGKGKSSYEGRGVSAEYHSSRFVYDDAERQLSVSAGKDSKI